MNSIDSGISLFNEELEMIACNDKFYKLLDLPKELFSVGDNLEVFYRYHAKRGEYGQGNIEDIVGENILQAKKFEPHRFERTLPDGSVLEVRGNPVSGWRLRYNLYRYH